MNGSAGVSIFWDCENCHVPSNTSGYTVVDKICSLAREYGSIKSFKAYLEISDQVQKSLTLRSELQSSGVTLIDCPHNGRKDVADKMIMVDMLAHAMDTPAHLTTMILITGDRDFAYPMSILKLRNYRVVLVTLSNAHISLTAQASVCLEWNKHILNAAQEASQTNDLSYGQGRGNIDYDEDIVFLQDSRKATGSRVLTPTAGDFCASSDRGLRVQNDTIKQSHRHQPRDGQTIVGIPISCPVVARQPVIVDASTEGTQRSLTKFRKLATVSLQGKQSTEGPFTDEAISIAIGKGHHSRPAIISACDKHAYVEKEEIIVHTSALCENPIQKFCTLCEESLFRKSSSTAPLAAVDLTSGFTKQTVSATPTSNATIQAGSLPFSTTRKNIASSATCSAPGLALKSAIVPAVPTNFKFCRRPLRSIVGAEIGKNGSTYEKAGVKKFGQLDRTGGKDGDAWIRLKPAWYHASI
ncbi:NYN domain-containing protein [Gymnopilus junonius]|uniref:NYN domain-containing protein n=1 Tax=Gymnopilus junonius TaxID=109634 RepID=A0A9P5NKU9_GYMJU|nr:NYN domain-containing protein [Gymnopilus junonius]